MRSNIIKFKNRQNSDYTNQRILEVFRDGGIAPDVDLVVANNIIVSAHRVILSMYSNYFRSVLSQSRPEPKFIVPLPALSAIVIQSVVELFYYGEINVLSSIKCQVIKALDFLEVEHHFGDAYSNQEPKPNTPIQLNSLTTIKPNDVNKTGPQVNDAMVKLTQSQNKPNSQPQPKLNDAKNQKIDQVGQCVIPFSVKNVTLNVTEKKFVSPEVPSMKLPCVDEITLEKNALLTQQNNQSTTQTNQLTIQHNVKPTPQANDSCEMNPVLDDNANEAVEMSEANNNDFKEMNENLTKKLVNYDVDKASEKLHLTVDAFMKEVIDDTEDMDMDALTDDEPDA